MNKKAQAALENLTTYAWAILIVIIAVGALAYFGVLNPGDIFPEKCMLAPGFDCVDFTVADDGVSIMLQNSLGRDIIINSLELSSNALSGSCKAEGMNAVLQNGKKDIFYANDPAGCSYAGNGRKNNYEIILGYNDADSNLDHKMQGKLFAGHDSSASVGGSGYGGYSNDLVGYWKFDESSGITVSDSSNYGNDGEFNGETFNDGTIYGADYTTGKYGNALQFDGIIDDYVNAGSGSSLDIYGEITLEAWVKVNAVSANSPFVVARIGNGWATWDYGLFFDTVGGGEGRWGAHFSNGVDDWNNIAQNQAVTPGTWQHIVGTYDGVSIAKLYINGVLVKTNNYAITMISSPIDTTRIGNSGGSAYANAVIDEVKIYNRVLSQSEIQADMNSPYPVNRNGLVASYSFEEGSGNTAYDTHNRVAGKYGSALSFDGVNDYVNAGNDVSLNITTAITVSAWVKPVSSGEGTYGRVVDKAKFGLMMFGGERVDFQIIVGGLPRDAVTLAGSVPFNTWSYVVGVFDGANVIIYVNGVKTVGSATAGPITSHSADTLYIGERAVGDRAFNGLIDEVRIWNRALTESEIQALSG